MREAKTHPEPPNGLLNTVARFEASRLNQGQPPRRRVAMEYIDNSAYEILENPEGVAYDMWDCHFHPTIILWQTEPTVP